MASKDYDDLLESFMNNSQKVYNDDKNKHDKLVKKLPSSYNTLSADGSEHSAKASKAKSSGKSASSAQNTTAKSVFSGIGKVLLAILMIILVVAIVCSAVLFIYGYSYVHGDKVFDLDKEKYSQNQTSFIYGYDDNDKVVEITRLHGEENRIWLSLDDMNPYIQKAFIACEDERFEKHHGVDWKRVGSVMFNPENSGQGGSTITQQLIKNLTDQNDVTFVRKFNEILSALNLEKHYSKNQIIEAYLNTIYLSHGCYGVRTAAETYFGKEVKNLNIAECACLAAITKAPTRYDPLLNPDQINPKNNTSRRNWVINKMYQLGYITKEQRDEAVNYKMVYTNSKNYKGSQVKKTKSSNDNQVYSYYTDYVIEEVLSDLQKMGYSSKKAENLLFGGGLKIYTAIDFKIQEAMDDVYVNYRRMPDETVQGACVVMDYKGRVLGIVGGTGKKKGRRELNRASQSERQPGSTIKPLSVYGPALEKSLNDPETEVYWSTPLKDAPLMKLDNGKWWPTNEGGGYSGDTISLQKGLALSKNTISARTLEIIGPTYSYDFMVNRWHITSLEVQDEDYAPMATGSLTNGVSVLEMTTAYQAFGNGGYYYEPYGYYKIEDSQGNTIIEKKPDDTKETALSTNTAGVMNKLLQTVMTEGTGKYYRLNGIESFGKTGTTSESKDRWFIGGTPEYMCGIWYGYDTPKEIHYGLSYNPCGTLWNLVMKNIYSEKGVNKNEFDIPDGVVRREYSPSNGKLTSSSGVYGWFDENNLPGYTNYVAPTQSSSDYDSNENKKKSSESTKEENSNSDSNSEGETQESKKNSDYSNDGEGSDNEDNE